MTSPGTPRWWHAAAAFAIAASWLTAFVLLALRLVLDQGLPIGRALWLLLPLHVVRLCAGLALTWRGTPAALAITGLASFDLFLLATTGDASEHLLVAGVPVGTSVLAWWSLREGRAWMGGMAAGFALVGISALIMGWIRWMDPARILLLAAIAGGWVVQMEFGFWPLRAWREAQRQDQAALG